MTGNLIHGTSVDSVRIDVLGAGRALTIPLDCLLCADTIMRSLILETQRLMIAPEIDIENNATTWKAMTGTFSGRGATPWQAIIDLSEKIK